MSTQYAIYVNRPSQPGYMAVGGTIEPWAYNAKLFATEALAESYIEERMSYSNMPGLLSAYVVTITD